MQDAWTGVGERLRIPKEEADDRRISLDLLIGVKQKRRSGGGNLREEKEKVEREKCERIEWRMREAQMRGDPEDHRRPTSLPGTPTRVDNQDEDMVP